MKTIIIKFLDIGIRLIDCFLEQIGMPITGVNYPPSHPPAGEFVRRAGGLPPSQKPIRRTGPPGEEEDEIEERRRRKG